MHVVLLHPLVQVMNLAEQVADDGVGVAGQILQVGRRLAAHDLGLLRQHDAEFRQQAADAVDGGGTGLDIPLAGAMR